MGKERSQSPFWSSKSMRWEVDEVAVLAKVRQHAADVPRANLDARSALGHLHGRVVDGQALAHVQPVKGCSTPVAESLAEAVEVDLEAHGEGLLFIARARGLQEALAGKHEGRQAVEVQVRRVELRARRCGEVLLGGSVLESGHRPVKGCRLEVRRQRCRGWSCRRRRPCSCRPDEVKALGRLA
eukprot:15448810-Alexandrium_andersonii.AAC.1